MAKFGELSPEDQEKSNALQLEIRSLSHAMQSGVAMKMNYDSKATEPKHLRVGVNSAMVEHSALAILLVEKGLITELEYFTAVRDGMKREVAGYEDDLTKHYGATPKITLA